MKYNTEQSKVSESKPNEKDDMKTLPMQEVVKKLGSSPEGFRQADIQTIRKCVNDVTLL